MEPHHMEFIAHHGGSFNPVDGRAWQPPTSSFTNRPNTYHPDHNIVQIGSETFCTVGEIQQHGWGIPSSVNVWVPEGPLYSSIHPGLPPTQIAEVVSFGQTERIRSQTAIPPSNLCSTLASGFTDANGIPSALADPSNGAASTTNRTVITSLDQCPAFWKLPLTQLYQWERTVDIQDESVRIYFDSAVKDAETDIDQALSQGLTLDLPRQQPVIKGRAPPAIRDDIPPNGVDEPSKFKFNKNRPDFLDLIFMRFLEELSPFGSVGQKGKVFHQCAFLLKTKEKTRQYFHALSDSENSRVLQCRYTQLKIWLAAAEGWSKIASGTEEEDAELRRLIAAVEHEEDTSRSLRMANKEVRTAHKERSLLAEDCREALATKHSRRAHSEVEEDGTSSVQKVKKSRTSGPSNADALMQEVISITRDLSHSNEAALTSQNEQNTRVNLLYERELSIAKQSADSLALHRKEELELQRSRLLFETNQASTSDKKIEALDAKLDANLSSINQSLAAMMKHIVGNSQ
ncbi:hypothetical protein DFH28DRAFT_1034857 [Melampsora americana]|nr:hypothetical protein DFH28DRAFT_1034857 [Melampsora americana]